MGSICSIFINESTLAMIHENVFGKGGGGSSIWFRSLEGLRDVLLSVNLISQAGLYCPL